MSIESVKIFRSKNSTEMLKKYFLCGMCYETTHGLPSIFCDSCECYIHFECTGITANHSVVKNIKEEYLCYKCDPEIKLYRFEKVLVENRYFSLDYLNCYPFECKNCPIRFLKKDQAIAHNMRVHEKKCPTCRISFDSLQLDTEKKLRITKIITKKGKKKVKQKTNPY